LNRPIISLKATWKNTLAALVAMLFCQAALAQFKADFTADRFSGCSPVIINFKDNSSATANAWTWDFGNGTPISTLKDAGTTYLNAGVYTVIHTATNTLTGETDSSKQKVTILGPPTMEFAASDTSGCFPLTVQFTDKTIPQGGNITSWTWDFGDGTVVNDRNPTHTYTLTGKFNVLLKVTQDNGCPNSLTKTQYINVAEGVKADFYTLPPAGCKPPFSIQFLNISTGPGNLSYNWDFGNGQTSTNRDDKATYPAGGNYNVKLVVTSDKGCSDTKIKPVSMPTSTIKSGFTSPDTVCVGQLVNFDNTSQPDPDSSFWNFGDGTTSQFLIPSNKSYSTSGIFTVKLVNKFGACLDSFSKKIVVPPPATINFSNSSTISCKAPFTVNFNDATPNAVSWSWQLTNGVNASLSQNGKNPSFLFTEPGSYGLYLNVTDKLGCVTSKVYPDYVKIVAPKFVLRNMPDSGCAPFTLSPDLQVTAIDGVKSYTWDWGDNNTSAGNPASHVYPTPGTFNASFRVVTNTGCDTTIFPGVIKVGSPTAASDFTATPQSSCAGTAIQFTDITSNPAAITGWQWDFGDGFSSDKRNPKYAYSDTGTFTVSLKVFNNGCGSVTTKPAYIQNYGTVARFNYTVDCMNRNVVTFRDSSLNATSWLWDFKDGSPTFNGKNPPPHTFPAYKDYYVELTSTNGACSFTTSRRIRVVNERADYTITPPTLCKGVTAGFAVINSLDTNLLKYEWNLGNGAFLTGTRTAQAAYTNTGTFTTGLRLTDVNGCVDSAFKPLGVGGPKADYSSLNPTGCKGTTVEFTDNSKSDGANAIIRRTWDFGDGTGPQVINAPPVRHTYPNPGSYSVKLKVEDGVCADSLTIGSFVVISEPKALFNTTDTMTCPGGRAVQFDNQTGGTINNFTWTFGDGQISNIRNPLHFYNRVGRFTVQLKIRDRYGCEDSLVRTNLVLVDSPQAAFTMTDSVGNCPPLKVDFAFTGKYQQSLRWVFGDGNVSDLLNPEHFYTRARTFIPTLYVTSPGGCVDSTKKKVVLFGPDGNITFTPPGGCEPLSVDFKATGLRDVDFIAWDFGDGLIKNKDSVQTHTYATNGLYYPVISLISDKLDCSVAIRLDSIKVIKIFPKVIADKYVICDKGTIQFTDSSYSVGTFTNWLWDFGDGQTSTLKNPSHYYANPGVYTVTITLTTEFGCTQTLIKPDLIRVVARPDIAITASADSICRNSPVTFHGIEIVADTSVLKWNWNFGNGQISIAKDPTPQSYGFSGTFSVQLVATNSSGCNDTALKDIMVMPLPPTDAGLDTTICLGQSVTLTASGAFNYIWQPPATALSCTTCQSPVATPTVNTRYAVIGFTAFGCSVQDSLLVTVIQPSTVVAPPDDSVCYTQGVLITATGTQAYSWSPAAGLSNPNVPNPVARPTATTNYVVKGSDYKGCFTTYDSVLITVFPYPLLFIGADTTISVGASLPLTASISQDVRSIQWQPGSTLSCTDCLDPVAHPTTTTTYKAVVTNDGGCSTSDEVQVTVICSNSNIFMPNTFSPNGDGMNDVYYPRGHGIQQIKSLRIFSRWGQLMYDRQNFSANDASSGWDGRFRGADLSPDVYVYILEVVCENGTVVSQKGDITLVR
jgi:gliding motility-associated-like protein